MRQVSHAVQVTTDSGYKLLSLLDQRLGLLSNNCWVWYKSIQDSLEESSKCLHPVDYITYRTK